MSSDSDNDNEQKFTQKEENEEKNLFTQIKDPQDYEKNSNCLVCSTEFSKFSSKRNCQFCGFRVCNHCSEKKRENPQQEGEYVRICDFCEQKFLRQRIRNEDNQQEQKLDFEIKQYEDMLKQLSSEYQKFLDSVQKNQQKEQKDNVQFQDKLEEKEEFINKLKKQQENHEQQLVFLQEDQQQTLKSLQETQENIELEEEKVKKLEEQHRINQEKIEEQEKQLQKLKTWLQSTTQNLDDWALSSKKFESFRKTGKESSVWGNQNGTYNQNGADIFMDNYDNDDQQDDNDDEGEFNSQQLEKLIQDD